MPVLISAMIFSATAILSCFALAPVGNGSRVVAIRASTLCHLSRGAQRLSSGSLRNRGGPLGPERTRYVRGKPVGLMVCRGTPAPQGTAGASRVTGQAGPLSVDNEVDVEAV